MIFEGSLIGAVPAVTAVISNSSSISISFLDILSYFTFNQKRSAWGKDSGYYLVSLIIMGGILAVWV